MTRAGLVTGPACGRSGPSGPGRGRRGRATGRRRRPALQGRHVVRSAL